MLGLILVREVRPRPAPVALDLALLVERAGEGVAVAEFGDGRPVEERDEEIAMLVLVFVERRSTLAPSLSTAEIFDGSNLPRSMASARVIAVGAVRPLKTLFPCSLGRRERRSRNSHGLRPISSRRQASISSDQSFQAARPSAA